jgi:hypothetical protein
MRGWTIAMAVALMAAGPVSGYAQSPSGDKMKDDKMKMEQGDKMMEKKDGKMMDKKGDKMKDKMSKDKMMEKKDDKMEKMEKK